jgi:hypothetical protein
MRQDKGKEAEEIAAEGTVLKFRLVLYRGRSNPNYQGAELINPLFDNPD